MAEIFTVNMLLGQGAEADGCGGNVVLLVSAPSRKKLLISDLGKQALFCWGECI
jgi:hypothetical protein